MGILRHDGPPQAVISNASVWDTLKLVPADRLPEQWRRERADTPACPSFMHLHVGFDAKGGCVELVGGPLGMLPLADQQNIVVLGQVVACIAHGCGAGAGAGVMRRAMHA